LREQRINISMAFVRQLPIVRSLKGYRASWLGRDVSAGFAIAAVGLPSAIAYPAIAGLPPETGLYASIFAAIGYALVGPSERLIAGPDAATMIMLAAVFVALGNAPPESRALLAAAIAVMVGIYSLLARLLHLDLVANFLSRPILMGFMTGISLSILIGQLGRLTGLTIEADGLLRPVLELASKAAEIHMPSLLLGLSMLALLLILKHLRFPVPGPVVVVVLAGAMSLLFDLKSAGIRVVGAVPSSLPQFNVPWPIAIPLNQLLVDSLAVWVVSFSAGIVTARAFGVQAGYRVDANKELSGFAAANVASGLFGGFPVTSSDSRTAINFSVGARTRIAGLMSAFALLAVLVYLNDLLRLVPVPALGAILAAAALSLMDFSGFSHLWRISRIEFVFAVIGLFAPVLFGVLNGVAIAVGATLGYLLYRSMVPRMVFLGRISGEPGFHKLHRFQKAHAVPGLTICLLQGSLLFYNADHVRSEIEAFVGRADEPIRWLILDAGSIPHMDTTAAATLTEINDSLIGEGIRFGIADLHHESSKLLEAAGTVAAMGREMVFDNLEDMFEAFAASR
jgi:high affinity sulfate transporter 1